MCFSVKKDNIEHIIETISYNIISAIEDILKDTDKVK